MWDKEYQEINDLIDIQNSEINRNERLQSNYMASRGEENQDLLQKHDELLDELHKLLEKRHEISRRVNC